MIELTNWIIIIMRFLTMVPLALFIVHNCKNALAETDVTIKLVQHCLTILALCFMSFLLYTNVIRFANILDPAVNYNNNPVYLVVSLLTSIFMLYGTWYVYHIVRKVRDIK